MIETLRFLGLEVDANGGEVYDVSYRSAEGGPRRDGQLRHLGGASWAIDDHPAIALGSPDEVFASALVQPVLAAETVAQALPHWPTALQDRLARRRTSGACSIAFDARWFLERLTGTAIDRPLLLPGAVQALELDDLGRAGEVVAAAAASGGGLLELLVRGLVADDSGWGRDGRLIGESTWGDLQQVGADIAEGCEVALGSGLLRVTFDPDEPMGVGFGPEVPSPDVVAGRTPTPDASVGTGLEIGTVDPGGAADAHGLTVGMVATGLHSPDLELRRDDGALPFEDALQAIDARRDAGAWLAMTFDTAAPLTRWYAVEMPAASTLAALGGPKGLNDAGVGASFDALCGPSLLWREPTPRMFLGAPGSVTCAHVDICPQVQLAHGLVGTKVLGVASHDATPRLVQAHGPQGDEAVDEGATYVPTDRPLSARQAHLLGDPDICLVLLRPGDLAVLHSGALHFASNGADAIGGSLYHGVITPAALPRLRTSAAASGGSGGDDAYAGHLHAADLLTLVEGSRT